MSSKMKAVLYWPDTEQVSTEDLAIINEEDRYQNAVTSVKMKNKFYKAVVRLISSDKLKLEAEEVKIGEEIDARLEEKEKDRGTRKRSTSRNQGAATANEVAASLGERLRPTATQAPKAKQLQKAKKLATAAQHSAQDDVDQSALDPIQPPKDARRELFKQTDAVLGETGLNDSEREDLESDDGSVGEYNSDDEENVAEFDTSQCCGHCLHLRKACNQSPALFIKAVSKFMGTSCTSGTRYLEVLEVPHSAQRVELSKGSKVYISNADKTYIKKEGGGDPAKMTRLGLVSLFGRENMEREQLTAKGQKSGSKGIRKNVRDALRAFVNRNKGSAYKDLDETRFNQVINRKKNSIHRVRKSPTSVKRKKVSPASSKTPEKTFTEQIPPSPTMRKQSPSKSVVRQSPFLISPLKKKKSASSAKSPLKAIQSPRKRNWNVNEMGPNSEGPYSSQGPQGPQVPQGPQGTSWGPVFNNAEYSQAGTSSDYSYNNSQPGYNYNNSNYSYPVGQGNYSSQPENWYQNLGNYVS